jgi:hypothetical protein
MDASVAKQLDCFRTHKRLGLPMPCKKKKAAPEAPKPRRRRKAAAKPAKRRSKKTTPREHFIHSQMSKGRTEAQAIAAWKLTHRK